MPNRYTGNSKYRYGYQGSEKDNEVHGQNGTSYTTEFRQLDPRVGRWLSTDPITHHQFSPYSTFDNNPIYWIDPNGANADDYGVDKKGQIVLLENNNKPDRLFSIDNVESKNKIDLNKNGNKNDDYITIKDNKILKDLAFELPKNTETNQLVEISTDSKSSNKKDMNKLFYFLSENTDVEWGLFKHKKKKSIKYTIATYHKKTVSPGYDDAGINMENVISQIHNHPNTKKGATEDDQLFSMSGDWVRFSEYNNNYPIKYYVYFPKLKIVWRLDRGPKKVKTNIKSYWGFSKFTF